MRPSEEIAETAPDAAGQPPCPSRKSHAGLILRAFSRTGCLPQNRPMQAVLLAFLSTARDLFRRRIALHAELLALRHQLLVLQRLRGGVACR